jgi:hypothetical protein
MRMYIWSAPEEGKGEGLQKALSSMGISRWITDGVQQAKMPN